MNEYEDIINLPHWNPTCRRRMSMEARASQFAPFAALKEGENHNSATTADLPSYRRKITDDQ